MLQKFSTDPGIIDFFNRGEIPSRKFVDEKLAHQVLSVKPDQAIFYPPDNYIMNPDTLHPQFLQQVRLVRGYIADALRCIHAAEVHEADQTEPHQLQSPAPRHYRLISPLRHGRHTAEVISPVLPRKNLEHPYLLPEVLDRFDSGGYLRLAPRMDGFPVFADVVKTLTRVEQGKVIIDSMLACGAIHATGDAHADVKSPNIFVRFDECGLSGILFDIDMRRPSSPTSWLNLGTYAYLMVNWVNNMDSYTYQQNDVFAFALVICMALSQGKQSIFSYIPTQGAYPRRSLIDQYINESFYSDVRVSIEARDIMMKMFRVYKTGITLPQCIPVLAREFGLEKFERGGNVYYRMPGDYVPGQAVQNIMEQRRACRF